MNANNINTDNFNMVRHATEPWTLFIPVHQALQWHDDMLWYRSRIQHDNGDIVSMGFPKFFNLGEREIDHQLLTSVCNPNTRGSLVQYSNKRDGSLIIRSNYGGKIIIRTRGSFDIGLPDICKEELKNLYTKSMLDPSQGQEISFLYEYTSPNNQIIVPYDKPQLVCVGAINHAYRPYVMTASEVQSQYPDMAQEFNAVEFFSFDSIHDLLEWVENKIDVHPEGIVVRINSRLIKLKNSDYLRKHYLSYSLPDKTFHARCLENSLFDENQFDQLQRIFDADYETSLCLKPRYNEYCNILRNIQESFYKAKILLDAIKNKSRKEIALLYKGHELFNIIMMILDKNTNKLNILICRQFNLDQGLKIDCEKLGFIF